MEIDVLEMARRMVELRGDRSQASVAADLRISVSALSSYETGKRIPRDEVKARIAKYYHRDVPYIFFNLKAHETCTEEG